MLIINADDLGRTPETTDRILDCFARGRITSASAMVFMEDSKRAAGAAAAAGLEAGLHLNLDEPLSGPDLPSLLQNHHGSVVAYLRRRRSNQLLYDPRLRDAFRYVFRAQYEEYQRLFGNPPDRIDGHDHMHLCMNVLADRLIPRGMKVRRNLFRPGQRSPINKLYRRAVDAWLIRRYICADAFFAIDPVDDLPRQEEIIRQGLTRNVELMVHPGLREEYEHLIGPAFEALLRGIPLGTYAKLPSRPN
jgi:chitin disaccharide deacetylase